MIFNGDVLNDFVFLGWFGGSQGLDEGKLDLADDIRRLKVWLRTKPGVRQRGTYPLHDPPPASFRVKPGQKGPDRQVRARFAVPQRIRDGSEAFLRFRKLQIHRSSTVACPANACDNRRARNMEDERPADFRVRFIALLGRARAKY